MRVAAAPLFDLVIVIVVHYRHAAGPCVVVIFVHFELYNLLSNLIGVFLLILIRTVGAKAANVKIESVTVDKCSFNNAQQQCALAFGANYLAQRPCVCACAAIDEQANKRLNRQLITCDSS